MAARTVKLLGIQAGKGARVPGAEDGPYVLRQRGLVERLTHAGLDVDDLGDIPGAHETRFAAGLMQNVNYLPNILQVNRHTHACVLGTRRKAAAAFLLVVGGDHSLAIGTLAGLSDACQRLGLLWVDAHADFNTPRSSPSGNIHGMSLAVACGRGHLQLRSIADRDPLVDEADVFLYGLRDVDPEERKALRSSHVQQLTTARLRKRGVAAAAVDACRVLGERCDHVHLSLDFDILDPTFAPGIGTPVPGGLRPDELQEMLRALGRQGVVASAEFVEFNPQRDHEGATAELALALIEALLSP